MIKRVHIDRRHLLALLGAAGATSMLARPAGAMSAADGKVRHPAVVVELFTSQGCSACPPADALLGRLINEPDVLGIGYNIDYWDYLGWRDTLARSEFTRRQRMYAKARGDDAVYTPQMIINGRHHVVGNDPVRVARAIEQARANGGCQLADMQLRRRDKVLEVVLGAADEKLRRLLAQGAGSGAGTADAGARGRHATLWMVTLKRRVPVQIRRGENRGRAITYHHVARRIVPAAMWDGRAQRLSLPLAEIMAAEAELCAALLQVGGHGPVIAAALL